MKLTLNLTDNETKALNDLAAAQGLSPEKLLIQALRAYQLAKAGGLPELPPKKAPTTET